MDDSVKFIWGWGDDILFFSQRRPLFLKVRRRGGNSRQRRTVSRGLPPAPRPFPSSSFFSATLCADDAETKEKEGKLRDSSSNPSSHGWQVIRKGEDIYIYSSSTFKHEYQSGRKSERKRNSLFAVKVNNLNGLVIDIPFFSLSNHTTLAWSNYRRVVVIENWSVRARGEDITIIERCLGWTMSKGLSDGLRAVDRTTFLPG